VATLGKPDEFVLLVGDNPFHGISHLSQERARARSTEAATPEKAAELVMVSLENGANGFMFSVSETTLSILRKIREAGKIGELELYAIVPYAFEYVRVATQTGTPGLVKRFAKQIAVSGDIRAMGVGLGAVMKADPKALLETYLSYELSRIKSAAKHAKPASILLHEVVTDMSLGLNLRWLFESYIEFMLKHGIVPGFNTRNFPYLVKRFKEWNIDLLQTFIATPFNKVGFQMNPSRPDCERTLKDMPKPNVLAISILASGYIPTREAVEYVAALPNIKGVSVGVSKEKHAVETFKLLKETLCGLQ
jgi:hypothetical protein